MSTPDFKARRASMMEFGSAIKLEITPPDSGFFDASTSPIDSPLDSPCLSAVFTPGSASTPFSGDRSLSRRPSRKSTLTQQQKNHKRQRATQDQLETLENEFCLNPTPTAAVRERIAQGIDMTERSVQIWFQNRRAKMKNIVKKTIENGEDIESAIPESMRRYLAMQAMESGRPVLGHTLMEGCFPYGSGLLLNMESNTSKVMIYHLACQSLNIGSFTRVGQSQLDLVVFYSPIKSMMTYYIQADGSGFRIEYPFSYIKHITLDAGDITATNEMSHMNSGGLIIELNAPPMFSVDQGPGGWIPCRDFTENLQASQVLVHRLGGHAQVLGGQLAKLISLDAYQNRHAKLEPVSEHLSIPFDPIGHRPASQPNRISPPRMNLFPSHTFQIPPPPSRGHKRQRSRSVPVAIDFSQLRPPKAPLIMHQHQHHHVHTHYPNAQRQNLYAPIPQHNRNAQFPVNRGPLGPTLSIDTSAGYGMDYPHCPPASSTTSTSPPSSSEYETRFLVAPASDTFAISQVNTPYNSTFLSPLPEHYTSQHASSSPLSVYSHQSPMPMTVAEMPETPLMRRTTSHNAQPPAMSVLEDLQPGPESAVINDMSTPTRIINFAPEPVAPMNFQVTPINYLVEEAAAVPLPPDDPEPVIALPEEHVQVHSSAPSDVGTEPNLTASSPALAEMSQESWLDSNLSQEPLLADTHFAEHSGFMLADETQNASIYDMYLSDPLADPFFDGLSDANWRHPLHDPIIESLHRHSRSKPSISTLPFRTFGGGQEGSMQSPPLTTTQHSVTSPVEEFSFGHMVHASEDFGSARTS